MGGEQLQGGIRLYSTVVHPFAPIAGPGSHTLILGTMASPRSRENGFYYGHPQNRFWPVLAAVYGRSVPQTEAERAALLLDNSLALWDVLASCEIDGAADASIRAPVPNDIPALLAACPIARVFTTGQTAARLYRRLVEPATRLPCTALPSPSPANRRVPFESLVAAYRALRDR